MSMYLADFSYTGVLMMAESNYDMYTMFHLRVHLTSKFKMAPFDLYRSTAQG